MYSTCMTYIVADGLEIGLQYCYGITSIFHRTHPQNGFTGIPSANYNKRQPWYVPSQSVRHGFCSFIFCFHERDIIDCVTRGHEGEVT